MSAQAVDAISIRAASPADAEIIRALAMGELGRSPRPERLQELLGNYPACVAEAGSDLVGFLFSTALAPDIIELANLLVKVEYRNQGVGSRLIERFESMARPSYDASILCNSELWTVARGPKLPATHLYLRHGYRVLYATSKSTVMIKEL